MIRLDRVEMLHWDMQPHQVLPLARGVTLLTGENASGKTSILDAIKIALGSARLDGERAVDDYLGKQAKSVVMIRVLADNRPVEGTRRRPFDRLGDISADVVTLGVVFRAAEDGQYNKHYLLIGGDVVPPLEQENRGFPFLSPTDYRARLSKVGITPRYLKLLALPQGRIADLCRRDPMGLFDDLYDIIGGKHALEEWERRVGELTGKQQEHALTRNELEAARVRLEALGGRARRHQEWLGVRDRLALLRAAIPYAEYQDARAKVDQLTQRVHNLSSDHDRLLEKARVAFGRKRDSEKLSASLESEREALERRVDQCGARWREIVREEAEVLARLKVLEGLRDQAAGIVKRDIGVIATKSEDCQKRLAAALATLASSEAEVQDLAADLEALRKGLLPLPADVTGFQEKLRGAHIAHHLLHEVIEIDDPEWQPALEGVLGRLRFAVVVADTAAWGRAAALARQERYRHGVLVPDVRGHSTADSDSAFRLIRVHDDSYRALVARILRSVATGEHGEPIVAGTRSDVVAIDGFVVSKIEARFADPEHLFIGRLARERRECELANEIAAREADIESLHATETTLRGQIAELQSQLDAQRRLEAWTAAQDEYAKVCGRRAELEGRREAAELSEALEKQRLKTVGEQLLAQRVEARQGADEGESAARDAQARDSECRGVRKDLEEAEGHLGTVAAQSLEPMTPALAAVVEEGASLRMLQALERQQAEREEAFVPDERDPMLPVNHQRQLAEVEAVETRLESLGVALEDTRNAAERAQRDYQQITRTVFRGYFGRLAKDAAALDFHIEGTLAITDSGRFRCDVQVKVGDKLPVAYSSPDLSGGQKAALSILMAMTAVSLETDGAGFFLVDEPFSASDVMKMNELGQFLARSGAQYLVSMPTSADLAECGPWLAATWTCTKTRGGFDDNGRPRLAPHVRMAFAPAARDA